MKKYKKYQTYYEKANKWEEGLIVTALNLRQAMELAEDLYGFEVKVECLTCQLKDPECVKK